MIRKKNQFVFITGIILFSSTYMSSCMRYLTHNRREVLLEGVDIDQTLEIAAMELKEKAGGKLGSVLTIWAIRDQDIKPKQAEEISRLYFQYIDCLKKNFDIWHLTWAISNIYRLGNDNVKKAIQDAYNDATKRAEKLSNIADKMANGGKLYMGDAHIGGRAFAKNHIVIPGNEKYLQSVEEYKEKKSK